MQQLGIIMPAAVIMEENFDKLLEQCEAQELEVGTEWRNSLFFLCQQYLLSYRLLAVILNVLVS